MAIHVHYYARDDWSPEARAAALAARLKTPKSEPLSEAEKRAAHAKLASLKPLAGEYLERRGAGLEGKHASAEQVFGRPHVNGLYWDVPAKQEKSHGELKHFPLSELTPAQEQIPLEGLRAYIEKLPANQGEATASLGGDAPDGSEYLPHVLSYKGRHFITAGHTRLGAQALAGRTHALVRHYRMDEHQNLLQPGT